MIWNSRSARLMVDLFLERPLPMLTACWQQGAAISGTTLNRRGFVHDDSHANSEITSRFGALQTWALERLISVQLGSGDLRWVMIALAAALAQPPPGPSGGRSLCCWAPSALQAAPRHLLTPWWQQASARLGPDFERSEPNMITLYGFGAGFGLPEISPFVTKTEVQLNMAGLAYRKEKAMPPASPKGQLPYIADEAETHRRFRPSSAPISRANTASISTRRSACSSARRPGRSSG